MEKIIVTVEVTDNNYSGYIKSLPGVISTGETFMKFKENMSEAVKSHLELMREFGEDIPEVFLNQHELEFRFDPQSLLQHYKGIFTNAALERITGINQRQLQHYASGKSKPKPRQQKKIEEALRQLGQELLSIKL
jgi:predicted RNase H-like HicB family nuclease